MTLAGADLGEVSANQLSSWIVATPSWASCTWFLWSSFPPCWSHVVCWLSKLFGPTRVAWREIVSTYAPAFVPLGFSMWLIHFSYHLLTAGQTALPVIQRAAMDVGITLLGAPNWSLSSTMPSLIGYRRWNCCCLIWGCFSRSTSSWRAASRFGLDSVP